MGQLCRAVQRRINAAQCVHSQAHIHTETQIDTIRKCAILLSWWQKDVPGALLEPCSTVLLTGSKASSSGSGSLLPSIHFG